MSRCTQLISIALTATFATATLLAGVTNSASAEGKFYTNWTALYPTSQSGPNVVNGTGTSCQLCHVNQFGGKNYNGYGKKMRDLLNSGSSTNAAITGSESFDSDGDPFGLTNLLEIQAGVQPGWTGGPHNTYYNNSGVTATGQLPPPAIAGTMDLCDGATLETVRLGTPPNPNAFLPGQTSGPVVGHIWDPIVDHTSYHPGAILDILVVTVGPPINLTTGWGTLLTNLTPSSIMLTKPAGLAFKLPVPLNCALVGIGAATQVASVSAVDVQLTNALDVVVGTY